MLFSILVFFPIFVVQQVSFMIRGGKQFFRMHEEYLFRMHVRNTDEASGRN